MYYLFLLGRFIALNLPRSAGYTIAKLLARLKFYFSKKDRKILSFNLSPVLKDKRKAKKIVKKIFENFALYLVDFFRFSKIDMNFVKKYVKVKGLNLVKKMFSEEKRIIAFTAHLGNYELGAALTSLLGCKICAVALPHRDKRLTRFFNFQRGIFGIEVVLTGKGIKRCFKALKEGKVVAFVGDRNFSHSGRKVKIFGKDCIIPRGPIFLSLRADAYIVPSFLIRKKEKFYELIFETPISPFKGERKKSEDEIAQECALVLEKYIRKYPEQWYIFERFWLE